MMGQNHIVTGVCALEHVWAASILLERTGNRFLIQGLEIVTDKMGLGQIGTIGRFSVTDKVPFHMIILLLVYFLGLLLPDIDNPNSMLGRFIHVPVRHRTWIHSIYPYLIIGILGAFYPVFFWLTFGVFVHLFWDSFSKMGNCWFYKLLSDYREYPDGARIKKGNHLVLYKAGEWSEYLLTFIIVILTVISFIYIRR